MTQNEQALSMKPLPQSSESSDNISAALDLVGESLQVEIRRINSEITKVVEVCDYETAQAAIDFAKHLTAFKSAVNNLGVEWLRLDDLCDNASVEVQQIVSKRFFGKSDNSTQNSTPFELKDIELELKPADLGVKMMSVESDDSSEKGDAMDAEEGASDTNSGTETGKDPPSYPSPVAHQSAMLRRDRISKGRPY